MAVGGCGSSSPCLYRFHVPNGTHNVPLLRVDYWSTENKYCVDINGRRAEYFVNITGEVGKGNPSLKQYQTTVADGKPDVSLWSTNGTWLSGIVIDTRPIPATAGAAAPRTRALAGPSIRRVALLGTRQGLYFETGSTLCDLRGRQAKLVLRPERR